MKTKELVSELKKKIEELYGKPCKDKHWCCSSCVVWGAYKVVKDAMEEV